MSKADKVLCWGSVTYLILMILLNIVMSILGWGSRRWVTLPLYLLLVVLIGAKVLIPMVIRELKIDRQENKRGAALTMQFLEWLGNAARSSSRIQDWEVNPNSLWLRQLQVTTWSWDRDDDPVIAVTYSVKDLTIWAFDWPPMVVSHKLDARSLLIAVLPTLVTRLGQEGFLLPEEEENAKIQALQFCQQIFDPKVAAPEPALATT